MSNYVIIPSENTSNKIISNTNSVSNKIVDEQIIMQSSYEGLYKFLVDIMFGVAFLICYNIDIIIEISLIILKLFLVNIIIFIILLTFYSYIKKYLDTNNIFKISSSLPLLNLEAQIKDAMWEDSFNSMSNFNSSTLNNMFKVDRPQLNPKLLGLDSLDLPITKKLFSQST
jgi:hypothetical protein